MSGRVVIPIYGERGRLVPYAGRSVDGRQPRYRFSSWVWEIASLVQLSSGGSDVE